MFSTPLSARLPTTWDMRRAAKRRLPKIIYDFIDGAASEDRGKARNADAFEQTLLMPRVLLDVSTPDLTTRLLGQDYALPFGVAPMGMCDLAGPGTDKAFAAEARRAGLPVGVSTGTSTSLEEMLRLTEGKAWFQLYVTGSVEGANALVERAAKAGYDTLLLTVDAPKLGRRPRDIRNGFKTPFRMNPVQFLDFALHPRWSLGTLAAGVPEMANFIGQQNGGYDRTAVRAGADWAYLDQLRARWRGKLIIKGVMSPEDALRIRDAGADAIYVSNHGGRQLESAPSTLQGLATIRAALGPEFPLIVDGGIRSGEDIVKALACGANFTMLGRPFLFASAAAGPAGVTTLVDNLREEIAIALAQVGLNRVCDLDSGVLALQRERRA